MALIRAVFFWLGGVLTEAIPQAAAEAIGAGPSGSNDLRVVMRDLAEELTLGSMTAQAFCQRAIVGSGGSLSWDSLEVGLRQRIRLREPVLVVIRELPGDLSLWLISDYPAAWIRSIGQAAELEALFPPERRLFTAEMGLSRLVPDIFPLLARRAGQPRDSCLLVDAVTPRAVEAIRQGMPAAIYVDPVRLRREFVLRRMTLLLRASSFQLDFTNLTETRTKTD